MSEILIKIGEELEVDVVRQSLRSSMETLESLNKHLSYSEWDDDDVRVYIALKEVLKYYSVPGQI